MYTSMYIIYKYDIKTSVCNKFETSSTIHACVVHIKLILHYSVCGVCQTVTLIEMITMTFHKDATLGTKCYPPTRYGFARINNICCENVEQFSSNLLGGPAGLYSPCDWPTGDGDKRSGQ